MRQSSKERLMLDGNEERGFITGILEGGLDCDRCGIILANYDGTHRKIEAKNTLGTTSYFPEDAFVNFSNAYLLDNQYAVSLC